MRRIAHLSDVHLLDGRRSSARYRMAARFVSAGRPLDATARATKLRRALAAAKEGGADHVVVTGDLTELGSPAEFEHAAEILHEAPFAPDAVTLVPGNHDAYTSAIGWRRALDGPLRAFRSGSAESAGKLVERGGVTLLPIDTSFFQNIALAGGLFSMEAARAVERRLSDPALRARTAVLVLHHSPVHRQGSSLLSFVDGLRGCAHVLELMAKHPRLQLLHGHLHRAVDRVERMFGAPAVVNDRDRPRVRFYDVTERGLVPVP